MPSFNFDSIGIRNTRAEHEDLAYVCVGLSVNGETYPPLARYIGDVKNGRHFVNLTLPTFVNNDEDKYVFSYLVVIYCGMFERTVIDSCKKAMMLATLVDFNASDAQLVQVRGRLTPKCLDRTFSQVI